MLAVGSYREEKIRHLFSSPFWAFSAFLDRKIVNSVDGDAEKKAEKKARALNKTQERES